MGSLTVHVLDADQAPVPEAEVRCEFPRTFVGLLDTHSESYTDDDGVAEFEDIPPCTVKVYVNGDHKLEIPIAVGDHEDVTVTLW